MKLRCVSLPAGASAVALAAAVVVTGCGQAGKPAAAPDKATTTPATPLHGEAKRVAEAVGGMGQALRHGDVLRLCRRGAIFTRAVVDEMGGGGQTCEASVEELLASGQRPDATVTAVKLEPRLASARVRVGPSTTVPLTLLRTGHRWLISFSDGGDPLAPLFADCGC